MQRHCWAVEELLGCHSAFGFSLLIWAGFVLCTLIVILGTLLPCLICHGCGQGVGRLLLSLPPWTY